jgi:PLAC8 family
MSSTISIGTTSTIRVVAPATLAEDYTFDVTLEGKGMQSKRPFTVTVPKGGVKKGQMFEVPFPVAHFDDQSMSEEEVSRMDEYDNEMEEQRTVPCQSRSRDIDDDDSQEEEDETGAPRGKWRHSLYACCDVVTQATFWTALMLPPVLLAQLATRLGLSFCGLALALDNGAAVSRAGHKSHLRPSSHTVFAEATEEANLSYNKIVLSFVAVLCLGNLLPGAGLAVVGIYVLVLTAVVGGNIRRSMRRRYRIPPSMAWLGNVSCVFECCRVCSRSTSAKPTEDRNKKSEKDAPMAADGGYIEDCCCMTFCACCSLIQMARHTHNDKEYPGFCCTTTGLEVAAPKIL